MPPQQTSPEPHGSPQAPQWLSSVMVSTQLPPQQLCPIAAQSTGQPVQAGAVGAAQLPPQQSWPAAQGPPPQLPQWSGSLRVSAHALSQQETPSPHALPHALQWSASLVRSTHSPPQQLSPEPQTMPQPPQLSSSSFLSTQSPPQQSSPSPQTIPQPPQFIASDEVSMHPPQSVCPLGHAHAPPMHVAPVGHARPQPPQFVIVEVAVSQPFVGSESQSPKPEAHVGLHVPLEHTFAVAFVVPQTTAHPPQFIASDVVSTHPLGHDVCPEAHPASPASVPASTGAGEATTKNEKCVTSATIVLPI